MDRVLAQFEEVTSVATATPGAAAWRAREVETGRQVLIKRLPGDEARVRATQALALHHPRIVPTRRWLRDEDALYVVRDFAPGRNLRQALGTAAHWAFDQLQALFFPLIDALEHAHGRGLSHGGVTPENVLVMGNGSSPFGPALLCDWATSLVTPQDYAVPPTPHTDYAALCDLYKEFLPTRPRDDEAGQAARTRLFRNLTEIQRTTTTADELRYKLDAVARMADLLGFSLQSADDARPRIGARLVVTVAPSAPTVNPGGGLSVSLTLRNDGDLPLRVEAIESNAVWLNPAAAATPLSVPPDATGLVPVMLSAARLTPGDYQAKLLIRSNSGLTTLAPTQDTAWHEQTVTLPVRVQGESSPTPPAVTTALGGGVGDQAAPATGTRENDLGDGAGIACTQEPDPGLVRYGQTGVLHLGVRNVGPRRLRLDRIGARPAWLVYPGDWKPLWIEPGAMQYLGFSVQAQSLAGGDYTAEVTLLTSTEEPTLVGSQTAWREMTCAVRIRVVRGAADAKAPALGLGCLPVLLALGASLLGLLAGFSMLLH